MRLKTRLPSADSGAHSGDELQYSRSFWATGPGPSLFRRLSVAGWFAGGGRGYAGRFSAGLLDGELRWRTLSSGDAMCGGFGKTAAEERADACGMQAAGETGGIKL